MIFFKAEANQKIGRGHLYRCLSIAKEFTKQGIECEFIFADSPDSSIQKAIDAGFKTHKITEAEQLDAVSYINFIPSNSVIVFDTDDYRFYSGKLIDTFRREKIYSACFSITDRHLITTDLLINPNIVSKTHKYKIGSNTKKYLGLDYFIMNEDFRNQKRFNKSKNINFPSTLLLIFGNADVSHLTIYFLSIISMLSEFFNKVIVVVGKLNPDIEKIKGIVYNFKEIDIELFIDTDRMIDIYKRCDFAITSAGMAMWEMSLFSIPQFVIASTPRELDYTNYLFELGYIKKLGDLQNLPSIIKMGEMLLELFREKQYEHIKTDEFSRIVNPNGVQLIVNKISSLLKK